MFAPDDRILIGDVEAYIASSCAVQEATVRATLAYDQREARELESGAEIPRLTHRAVLRRLLAQIWRR
jgi:hypothetical protein